jgi:two-component system response regulator DesR
VAEIATKLHVSEATARNYLSEASQKPCTRLRVSQNRVEAARIAEQKGWL